MDIFSYNIYEIEDSMEKTLYKKAVGLADAGGILAGTITGAGQGVSTAAYTLAATALTIAAGAGALGGMTLAKTTSPTEADVGNMQNEYLANKLKLESARGKQALNEGIARRLADTAPEKTMRLGI